MKKKSIALVLAVVCAAGLFAEDTRVEMPRFEIPSARSNGFGGSHIAYTDNVFALLVNPAAIMRVRDRSVFAPSFTLLSPEKTAKLIGEAVDGDFGKALQEVTDPDNPVKIPLGFALNEFPVSFAWVADGFGFGVWSRVFVNANIDGMTAKATVTADLVIPVGFAFKILDTDSHDVDAGVALKIFGGGYGNKYVNAIDAIDDLDALLDDLGMPVIMGAGLDLGFLYRWDVGFSAGVTFDDVFTHGGEIARVGGGDKQDGYYVPFSLNLGVAYDMKIGNFWKSAPGLVANTGITAAVDWRNLDVIFETKNPYLKRNPVLGLGVGLQFTLVDIFKLRFGMNEMLPAFGFGFDLGSFEIDVAYYGKELGLEPGNMPSAALDLTFAIRPGAKERRWPWTRTSLVEMIQSRVKESDAQPASGTAESPVSEEPAESRETNDFIPEEEAGAEEALTPDNTILDEWTPFRSATECFGMGSFAAPVSR
jgi:hypothetical protein